MFAVRPCLHPNRALRSSRYTDPFRYSDAFVLKLLSLYEKKRVRGERFDCAHLVFETDRTCTVSDVMQIRVQDVPPIDRNQKKKKQKEEKAAADVKSWLEDCERYLMHLPFPQLYMLMHYDDMLTIGRQGQGDRMDRLRRHEALLFQLQQETTLSVVELFKQISAEKKEARTSGNDTRARQTFTLGQERKAIRDYWNDVEDIIAGAPPFPPDCPVVLYRGSSRKETKYVRPFSATLDVSCAQNYTMETGVLHVYHVQEGVSLLPLFYLDAFPYENEALMSSRNTYDGVSSSPKGKEVHYVVRCGRHGLQRTPSFASRESRTESGKYK